MNLINLIIFKFFNQNLTFLQFLFIFDSFFALNFHQAPINFHQTILNVQKPINRSIFCITCTCLPHYFCYTEPFGDLFYVLNAYILSLFFI
jgi:hypothetical protein